MSNSAEEAWAKYKEARRQQKADHQQTSVPCCSTVGKSQVGHHNKSKSTKKNSSETKPKKKTPKWSSMYYEGFDDMDGIS